MTPHKVYDELFDSLFEIRVKTNYLIGFFKDNEA